MSRAAIELVESQHGGTATYARSVPVYESHKDKTVWNGSVAVFDLKDSPSGATRAYAWSHGLPDGRRQSYAILHVGPIISPRDAVRAAIEAEARTSGRADDARKWSM
jgi:hypothetical protein